MKEEKLDVRIPDEIIMNKIFLIREKKVMLDYDLAELYAVETKHLKRAVRRNIRRFPEDFMFELSPEEFQILRSQFGTSSWGGSRYPPMAFTEHGVVNLASILKSERAIEVNIRIIRVYNKMRQILRDNTDIRKKLEKIQNKLIEHENGILVIMEYINHLEEEKQKNKHQSNRKRIGYK